MQKEKYVVFDFDGTISTLRYGWESIMKPMMLEMIAPAGNYTKELEKEVEDYIDSSTGIQTAYQMQWLADRVKQATGSAQDVWYYKDCYNERILNLVAQKKQSIKDGKAKPEEFLIEGSVAFLQALKEKGCRLFLASGTDDADVKEEAKFLGVDGFFELIKGAPAGSFGCSKEKVMKELMESAGDNADMSVLGDGKVEIALGKSFGATAIGIASNEELRKGIDERKRPRLEKAGADAIFGDFTEKEKIIDIIMR